MINSPMLQKYFEFLKEIDSLSDLERKRIIKILENKKDLNSIEKEILPVLKDRDIN